MRRIIKQWAGIGATIAMSGLISASFAQETKTAAKSAKQDAPAATTAKQGAAKAPVKVDTLVITGRVLDIPGTFPPNDLYNYVYVMKYRVVKVVKGAYTGKEILVGQYNPLIPRSQIKDKMDKFVDGNVQKFEVGAKHNLTLITPISSVWSDAIEDEYFDSDLPKYYALKTDVAAE